MSKILLIILVLSINAYASSSNSTSGAILMKLPTYARNLSLGNAGCADYNNSQLLDYNPAGVVFLEKTNVNLSYINLLSDLQINSMSYSEPISKNSILSISLKIMNSDKINKTEIIDWKTYSNQGTFDIKDILAGITFSQKTDKNLNWFGYSLNASYGITAKYYKSQMDAYSASAIAFDAGIFFKDYKFPISYGISILNIGTNVRYVAENDPLPTIIKAGIAYKSYNENLVILLDLNKQRHGDISINSGIELSVNKIFYFRVGYDSSNDIYTGYSLGTGISYNILEDKIKLNIDYAYKPYNELNDYHLITLNVKY